MSCLLSLAHQRNVLQSSSRLTQSCEPTESLPIESRAQEIIDSPRSLCGMLSKSLSAVSGETPAAAKVEVGAEAERGTGGEVATGKGARLPSETAENETVGSLSGRGTRLSSWTLPQGDAGRAKGILEIGQGLQTELTTGGEKGHG